MSLSTVMHQTEDPLEADRSVDIGGERPRKSGKCVNKESRVFHENYSFMVLDGRFHGKSCYLLQTRALNLDFSPSKMSYWELVRGKNRSCFVKLMLVFSDKPDRIVI